MRAFTLGIYGVFGAGAVVGGFAAVVAPRLVVPADELPPLAAHLAREEGAAFVFVGCMLLWCVRHFDRRRAVHLAMILFTGLMAAIHWAGPQVYLAPALANTAPFVLFLVTAPFRAAAVSRDVAPPAQV